MSLDPRTNRTRLPSICFFFGLLAEEYLAESPTDVQAWISYAQMAKRMCRCADGEADAQMCEQRERDCGATVTTGEAGSSGSGSTSTVLPYGPRRIIRRALRACDADARVLQAWGLLELQHGVDVFGLTLLEFSVSKQHDLCPVLHWRKVGEVRERHLSAGLHGTTQIASTRMRNTRKSVMHLAYPERRRR